MKQPLAKRSLGQNFLVDDGIISRIVGALDISSGETVIEIGPGRGALTKLLVEKAERIIALELDRHLAPFLADKFSENRNFTVLESDALQIDFNEITPSDKRLVKLVANLPYYISTAILQRLIEQRDCFSSMVLMFQKEVVDRITALPGNSERGFLTVLAEAYITVENLFDVPPEAFRPQPKVWSSVVRVTPKTVSISNEKQFRGLVSSSFLQKRKTILNNLKNQYANAVEMLSSAGIDPKLRPEALTLDQWVRLSGAIR